MLKVDNSFELKFIAGLEKKISATLMDLHSRLVDRLFPFRHDKCCVYPTITYSSIFTHNQAYLYIITNQAVIIIITIIKFL